MSIFAYMYVDVFFIRARTVWRATAARLRRACRVEDKYLHIHIYTHIYVHMHMFFWHTCM